ncbi:MAG: transporter, family, multidrug resistance protein [Solirubrobacteraceae bacterium]|nr:transporter, family, multidrug resistance protein [Solirubrobacteraceae bacterium]
MTHAPSSGGGFFAQPKAVWAVAFAAVVSFMGLGLVDPILPAIAKDLKASPSQVELLFTSYFAVTGVSMLVTSAVASRIGSKRTLLAGLALIVVFSGLAGASNSIGAIVGLRAGWGLGNALFIATALSVIIGSASGGVAGAVVLYEAALGLGISVGPLLGGELGAISWRGPFFGVAVLMTIGFVATAVLLDRTPAPPASERISVLEPLRALRRHREVRGSALTSAFYNFGFFTLLAYTPFALGLGAHELGYIFFGWGLMLAIFAVFVAPAISRRVGDVRGLGVTLAGFAALLAVMGVLHASQTALIIAVVVAGTFLGVINTLMTQLVMESAPVARPVASAAYSFVRFCGGAIAPFVAGKLAEHVSVGSPFYLGAGMTAIAVGVLWFYRGALVPAPGAAPAAVVSEAPESAPAPAAQRPMVVAVGGPAARRIAAMAVPLARARGAAVHVLHVVERDVLAGEDAVDRETPSEAQALLEACVAELRESGVPVAGELVRSVGTHADVAEQILRRATELDAGAIVLGPDTHEAALAARVTARIAGHAPAHVIVLNPRAGALGRPAAGSARAPDGSAR